MEMEDEIPIDMQRIIIQRQINAWYEKRFDLQLAHKVHTGLKTAPEGMATIVQELTLCEKALAILDEELHAR